MNQWKVRVQDLADMDLYVVYKPMPDGPEQCLGKFHTMKEAAIVCDKVNLKEEYLRRVKNE